VWKKKDETAPVGKTRGGGKIRKKEKPASRDWPLKKRETNAKNPTPENQSQTTAHRNTKTVGFWNLPQPHKPTPTPQNPTGGEWCSHVGNRGRKEKAPRAAERDLPRQHLRTAGKTLEANEYGVTTAWKGAQNSKDEPPSRAAKKNAATTEGPVPRMAGQKSGKKKKPQWTKTGSTTSSVIKKKNQKKNTKGQTGKLHRAPVQPEAKQGLQRTVGPRKRCGKMGDRKKTLVSGLPQSPGELKP